MKKTSADIGHLFAQAGRAVCFLASPVAAVWAIKEGFDFSDSPTQAHFSMAAIAALTAVGSFFAAWKCDCACQSRKSVRHDFH